MTYIIAAIAAAALVWLLRLFLVEAALLYRRVRLGLLRRQRTELEKRAEAVGKP